MDPDFQALPVVLGTSALRDTPGLQPELSSLQTLVLIANSQIALHFTLSTGKGVTDLGSWSLYSHIWSAATSNLPLFTDQPSWFLQLSGWLSSVRPIWATVPKIDQAPPFLLLSTNELAPFSGKLNSFSLPWALSVPHPFIIFNLSDFSYFAMVAGHIVATFASLGEMSLPFAALNTDSVFKLIQSMQELTNPSNHLLVQKWSSSVAPPEIRWWEAKTRGDLAKMLLWHKDRAS